MLQYDTLGCFNCDIDDVITGRVLISHHSCERHFTINAVRAFSEGISRRSILWEFVVACCRETLSAVFMRLLHRAGSR